jgi:hypothetical protein
MKRAGLLSGFGDELALTREGRDAYSEWYTGRGFNLDQL